MTADQKQKPILFPLLIAATYLLSRLLFFLMGVRFDASGLDWYWQYLDVELLQTDLIRSTFHQHSQPPLFNLFLGTVLKLFPNACETAFSLIFKAGSFALYYSLFRSLCLVRLKPWIAYAAATLFILSPGAVLYENWLFYTWPTAALLTCSAHQLLLYEKSRRPHNALLYLAGICAVCLTRSMFHLVYLLAAIVPILLINAPARKRLIPAAGLALLLVGALFLKNLLLFGFFGTSSWMGMNLWKVVPTGGKQQQLANSSVAQIEPFSPLAEYPEAFRAVPASLAAVPAVADELKQNGKPNLNHFGYIAISDAYKQKAVDLIKSDPPGYAGIVLQAWGKYCSPARGYFHLSAENSEALKGWIRLYTPADARLLVPLGLLLTAGGVATIRKQTAPMFFLFCAGTVFYIALLGNLLEHGENMRFRVQTDPLLYLAALTALSRFRATYCSGASEN